MSQTHRNFKFKGDLEVIVPNLLAHHQHLGNLEIHLCLKPFSDSELSDTNANNTFFVCFEAGIVFASIISVSAHNSLR